MNTIYRLIIGLALAVAFFGGAASPTPALAAGVKRTVDDNGVECPNAGYSAIGDAIAASGPGDTITVCDGVYAEQLVIASKPGLKLIGKGMPRIVAPANANGAMIMVTGSRNVTIQGLGIEGNSSFSIASTWMAGIAFEDSSGTISKNFISGIRHNPMDTLPQGDGILVYGNPAPTPQPVKILNNTIYDFQHSGIWMLGKHKPTITRNLIQTTSMAGNYPSGIMLNRLDSGSINNNVITSDWGEAVFPYLATGITLLDTSHVKVASNTVRAFRVGVDVESQVTHADANTISGNRIFDCFEGVSIYGAGLAGSNNNVVKSNKIVSTAYWFTGFSYGVVVEGGGMANGNKITGNTIQAYAKPGYWDNGMGTVKSGNKWAKTTPPGS